jgi:hypothetical protein
VAARNRKVTLPIISVLYCCCAPCPPYERPSAAGLPGQADGLVRAATLCVVLCHGLRTPGEEIAFTAQPKIKSQSQIYRYGLSIFCLPQRPNFSDIFYLCLHWVSVVRVFCHPCSSSGEPPLTAHVKITIIKRCSGFQCRLVSPQPCHLT